MDRLASIHLMHGFLNVPSHRRRHITSPNCQNIKSYSRSLSLTDRRGLISPMRGDAKGLISPVPSAQQPDDRFGMDDTLGGMMPMHHTRELVSSSRSSGGVGGSSSNRRPGGFFRTLGFPSSNRRRDYAGEVLLSLCYLPDINKMTVSVAKARNLPNQAEKVDKLGIPDPYVNLSLMDRGYRLDKKRTQVKAQTRSPLFNENFLLTVPSKNKLMSEEVNLVVSMMDYDLLGGNDEIGHTVLGQLGSESGARQWADAIRNPEKVITCWQPLTQKW